MKLAAEGADNRGEFAFGGVGVGDKGFTMETFFRDNGVDEAFRGGGDDQGNAVAVGDAQKASVFIDEVDAVIVAVFDGGKFADVAFFCCCKDQCLLAAAVEEAGFFFCAC